MSSLFESRAAVLEYEAKQRLVEKEIELEKLRQQPREWVGLTDDEVYRIAFELEGEHWRKIADAIEAKLKDKNT